MVTEATPQTEAEVTPTPEATTPEIEDGDSLLIPQEEPEVEGQDTQEEGATEAEAGAAKTEEETPAQTIAREEHEAELAKVRSGLDKRIAELEKTSKETVSAAEKRAAELEQQLAARTTDIQAAEFQRSRAAHWQQQGYTDEAATTMAALEASLTKNAFEEKMRADRLQAQLDKASAAEKSLSTRQAAVEMAAEHDVSDDDMPLLMTAASPKEMESLAKRLGAFNKQAQELAELKESQVPAGGDDNKFDSGGGGASGMTDDQFMAAYASGESDDHERAMKISQRMSG